MERKVEKIDDSHDRCTFIMQGTKERDAWQRIFPWPIPDTHRLTYAWDAEQMHLTVEVVPVDHVETELRNTEMGPVLERTRIAPPINPEWSKMPDADWQTYCAEKGLTLNKKQSRAQQAAALAAHLAKK